MRRISVQNERETSGNRVMNFRTLSFCALFFCLGIFFVYLFKVYGVSLWYALLLIPIVGIICMLAFTLAQWRRICVSVALLVCAFALGATLFSLQVQSYERATLYNGEYAVVGRVVDKETDGSKCVLTLDKLYVAGERVEGKTTVYLPASYFESTSLSDEVFVEGTLQTKAGSVREKGFYAYAIEEDTRYTMTAERCTVTGGDFHLFLAIRNRMEEVTYAGMDDTPAAVTMATLTGNTTGIEEGLLDNIRRGGIAHIFAVSGLHIGALYAVCLGLIERTKLRKTPKVARFCILLVILLFYGGICGYSASVIRAIVMCLLLYVSKQAGLGNDMLESISTAAIVVLLLSPVSLFTVGFQLSFAACYGIALFSRRLQKGLYRLGDWVKYTIFRRERKPFVLEEDTHPLNTWQRIIRAVVSFLSVTLAAQIATTPVQVAAFSNLSVWSLLLNCLFVPIISALFSLLLAFVFLACILPTGWSAVLLYLPNVLWSGLLLPFEGYTFGAVTIQSVPVLACVSYYTSAILCCGKWNAKKKLLLPFAAAFAIACACIMVFANVS